MSDADTNILTDDENDGPVSVIMGCPNCSSHELLKPTLEEWKTGIRQDFTCAVCGCIFPATDARLMYADLQLSYDITCDLIE